jgi:hypothetical protein
MSQRDGAAHYCIPPRQSPFFSFAIYNYFFYNISCKKIEMNIIDREGCSESEKQKWKQQQQQ